MPGLTRKNTRQPDKSDRTSQQGKSRGKCRASLRRPDRDTTLGKAKGKWNMANGKCLEVTLF